MNGKRIKRTALVNCTALASLLLAGVAHAQVPVDGDGNPIGAEVEMMDPAYAATGDADGALSALELEELVGPIALYPDDLLAIVLPASTYPLDVVQAARYLEDVAGDPSLEPDENWDDSIVALLNYPEVVEMMNDDIDWTWALGEAVVSQQSDVILAIESFRDRAYAAGNLKSDERQNVNVDDAGVIEIEPVEDDIIYVPYYEPERVVYASPTPVYNYYPRAYPVYYYPYPRHHYLTSGLFWGVTTAFTIGWMTDHLHVYHHSYHGHPFYGRTYGYYGSYWRRPSINVYNSWYVNTRSPYYRHRYDRGDYWRPRNRSGARPRTQVVDSGYYRNRDRRGEDDRRYRNRRIQTDANVYRDRRTDGTRYRTAGNQNRSVAGNNRTTRNGAGNRLRREHGNNANGNARNRTGASDRGRNRDEIRFRSRGDGSYTATRSERVRAARAEENRNARATQRTRLATQNARAERVNRARNNVTHREAGEANRSATRPSSRATETRRSTSGDTRRSNATSRSNSGRATAPRQSRTAAPRQSRSTAPRSARTAAPREARTTAPRSARNAAPRQARSQAPRQVRQAPPRQQRSSAPRQQRSAAPRSSRSTKARSSSPERGNRGRSGQRSRNRNN